VVDTKDEKRLGDNAFYEPWWNMVDAGMADTPSATAYPNSVAFPSELQAFTVSRGWSKLSV